MESYDYLLALAVILLSTKILGLMSQKIQMPQVVGALIAGFILGPSGLNFFTETDFLAKTAEIGVILLMFLAGLETDLQELKKNGIASLVVAFVGIIVPLVGGAAVYICFNRGSSDPLYIMKAAFVGVVLTATSVSITVETLRELGKLQGKVGTTILGAAIIDDIVGIIVLTAISSVNDPSVQPSKIILKIVIFFVFVSVVAVLAQYFQNFINSNNHKHRAVIYGISFCLIMAYLAEKIFGVADITGAYFAGLILCTLNIKEYIAEKVKIPSFAYFTPVFFASIGMTTDLHDFNGSILLFSIVLLLVAILTKVIGCGLGAKLVKFSNMDSIIIGVGMVSRGEVALIVAQKGFQLGLLDNQLFPSIVLVVIITTLITPILLKMLYHYESKRTFKKGK